jgi:hypothetical protein
VEKWNKYRRLLAYVCVGATMINAELVRQGYAQVATFPPNVKYQELFLQLQREAREVKGGMEAVSHGAHLPHHAREGAHGAVHSHRLTRRTLPHRPSKSDHELKRHTWGTNEHSLQPRGGTR